MNEGKRPLLTLRNVRVSEPEEWTDAQRGIKAVLQADYLEIKDFYEYLACNDKFTKLLKETTASALNGTHPDSHALAVILIQTAKKYFIEQGYNNEK